MKTTSSTIAFEGILELSHKTGISFEQSQRCFIHFQKIVFGIGNQNLIRKSIEELDKEAFILTALELGIKNPEKLLNEILYVNEKSILMH